MIKLTEKDGIPVYLHDVWDIRGIGKAKTIIGLVNHRTDQIWVTNTDEPYNIGWAELDNLSVPLTFMGQDLCYERYVYKYPGQEVQNGVWWSELFHKNESWIGCIHKTQGRLTDCLYRCLKTEYCFDCERPKACCKCTVEPDQPANLPKGFKAYRLVWDSSGMPNYKKGFTVWPSHDDWYAHNGMVQCGFMWTDDYKEESGHMNLPTSPCLSVRGPARWIVFMLVKESIK